MDIVSRMAIDFDKECFFIGPIGPDDSEIRERSDGVLQLIVREAAKTHELETRRADEFGEPGEITPQIVEHCLKAKMCVADLTEGNPNVYYELSVRHGKQLPVVLIADSKTVLPFDLGGARVVFFDSTSLVSSRKAREEVKTQIGAALEEGVPASNPIANGLRIAQLEGGDAGDGVQLLMLERLEKINHSVHALEQRMLVEQREQRRLYEAALRRRAVSPLNKTVGDYNRSVEEFNRGVDIAREQQEGAREAEEAGLSPNAYLDDEIVEADPDEGQGDSGNTEDGKS